MAGGVALGYFAVTTALLIQKLRQFKRFSHRMVQEGSVFYRLQASPRVKTSEESTMHIIRPGLFAGRHLCFDAAGKVCSQALLTAYLAMYIDILFGRCIWVMQHTTCIYHPH